jgi:hypothetical protein
LKSISALLVGLCLIALCGCGNVKNKKITENNQKEILQQIKNSKDLTGEELQLLQGAMFRSAFQGHAGLPVGKTVGEVIKEQREWVAKTGKDEKEQKEREKRLAAEQEARVAEMRKALTVGLAGFEKRKGYLSDFIEAQYAYENTSGREIRAFQGTVVYSDVLGNHLDDDPVKVLKPIRIGGKGMQVENLPLMLYHGLGNKNRDDVKAEWKPEKILFADGTSLGGSPNE